MGATASVIPPAIDGEVGEAENYDPTAPEPHSMHSVLTDAMLQNIRLIEFENFMELGTFPRFPQCYRMVKSLSSLNIELYHKSLIVFISHCWLRGWPGAEGWDGRPHPDNAKDDKFKLCIEGIKFIKQYMAPGMEKCYVWLDFGCIDQEGNPAGELKMLDKIIEISDCIFTPIYDPNPLAWDLPSAITNMYTQYASPAWIGTPHSYLNRGWCRVEMFYAANIPLFNPPMITSSPTAEGEMIEQPPRHTKFTGGFAFQMQNGRRPHILFGSYEQKRNYSPFIMPPLLNSWFEEYHPEKGNLSVPSDKDIIHRLVEDIRPYMKEMEVGYFGERNKNGVKHGKGREVYPSGDFFEGTYVNGSREGYGKYVYSDGDSYVGEYKNDKPHGKGKFTFGNGAYYDGDWVNGLKEGFGFYDYTEGNTYEGEWVADNAHGKGKMMYEDGSVYVGDFIEDLRHGQGRMVDGDGVVYDGQWTNDRFIH